MWVPDWWTGKSQICHVISFSVNSKGNGLLQTAIQTDIIVDHSGNSSWLSPLVLNTRCAVEIADFPFDSQSCLLRFGLWTYARDLVNFSFAANHHGDISSYSPNGEWKLEQMSAQRRILIHACCPDLKYPVIDYMIVISRRSLFYYVNIVFPGMLMTLVGFFAFLSPPESRQRVGLGISLFLGLTLLFLVISEKVPHTSDAIPLVSKFFAVINCLAALVLLESCVVIRLLSQYERNIEQIPFVFHIIKKTVLMLHPNQAASIQESPTDQTLSTLDNREQTRLGDTKNLRGKAARHNYCSDVVSADRNSSDDETEKLRSERRKMVTTIDRIFALLCIVVLLTTMIVLSLEVPKIYVA